MSARRMSTWTRSAELSMSAISASARAPSKSPRTNASSERSSRTLLSSTARAGPPHGLVDERCLADASRSPDQDGGASLPVGQTGADQGQLTVPSDE